jgi:hypothetical protein
MVTALANAKDSSALPLDTFQQQPHVVAELTAVVAGGGEQASMRWLVETHGQRGQANGVLRVVIR